MRLRAFTAAALTALLLGCGGTADLIPLAGDRGEDMGRPLPEVRALTCAITTGEAPYETACTFELATTDVADVTCTYSVTGGTAEPAQVEGCTGGKFYVRVDKVGTSVVEVRAQRVGGSALRASVELQGMNAAPKISTFAAAKTSGTAPLTTTLSWELFDANADAVSCEVSVDGVIEATVSNCLSVKTSTHTFQSGEHQVTLTATDARGASATSTVVVRGVQPVGDLRIQRVEYGQTVLSPSLRLVAGKAAVVRVTVISDTANLATTAKLSRVVAGQVVETVTLVGPATAPTVSDPSSMAKSYNFRLPASAVVENLELRIEVDPSDVLPETDETNNTLTVKPAVGKSNAIDITAVPVIFGTRTATISDFGPSLVGIFALKSVTKKDRAPFTFTGDFTDSYGGWSNLLGDIASLRNMDGSQDYYFGLIDTGSGGGIAGLGFLGQPAAVGLSTYGHVIPHEIGHNLSLPHAPCGPVSGAAGGYPYAGGEIGTYGIDVESMQLIPNTYKDLMSYCQPTWISDYFYKQSQTFLESQSFSQPPPSPPAPMILVRGYRTADGRVSLKPVHRVLSRPTRNGGEGLLMIETATGTVETRFQINEEAEQQGQHFTVLLPDPGEIKVLKLSLRGLPIAVRTAAASVAGEAQVLERSGSVRVRWNSKLHPSATLAYVNGSERTTFALDLKNGDAEVITGALPSGGAFEVSLSDSLNGTTIRAQR